MTKLQSSNYNSLKESIALLLAKGRQKAAQSVNTILIETYWQIGKYIVEFEQAGNKKAEYGKELLTKLSKDLTLEYGKGFSRSNLFQIRAFYLRFSKIQTVSGQFNKSENLSLKLSWSHYVELLKTDDDLEISFYLKQCEKENWSVRELKRQMKSMLFHRLALSKDKNGILELSHKGQEILESQDIIKDPYVLEFLNIPQANHYLEGEL